MTVDERQAFFADETMIDIEDYIIGTYWFETSADPRSAAAVLCMEQSTAQWKRPGIDEDFRPKHAAKVIGLEVLDESSTPSFASPFVKGGHFSRCLVRIAHPHWNFGAKIPALLSAVAGEGVYYCLDINAIKLLDLTFPSSYLDQFEGPRFGVEGFRKILNVSNRPLFFGVVKPNIGLEVDAFARLAYESWIGGLDIAKDDEMLTDVIWSPLKERVKAVGRARRAAEQKTGEKKMYLANITDEVDRLCELHDTAVELGANAVMVNGLTTGLSAIRMLRKHATVPIVGHFAMLAPLSRLPFFGIDSTVMTKLQRISGCDGIIMPGFGNRMMTSEEEVLANAGACAGHLSKMPRSLPAPGGSDWAGSLATMLEKLGTIDFGIIPGRGVFGHPMGPKAGAMSLCQAWSAYLNKVSIDEYAKYHPELAAAIKAFGGRTTDETNRHGANHSPDIEHWSYSTR